MAYTEATKSQVLKVVKSGEMTQKQAAKRFKVSASAISLWVGAKKKAATKKAVAKKSTKAAVRRAKAH